MVTYRNLLSAIHIRHINIGSDIFIAYNQGIQDKFYPGYLKKNCLFVVSKNPSHNTTVLLCKSSTKVNISREMLEWKEEEIHKVGYSLTLMK